MPQKVVVVGQAAKIKNYRHDPNGLKPFFEGLRFPKAEQDKLTYLCEEGMMVRITIEKAEASLFETEVAEVTEGSPRVSETPYLPSVSIVAVQEAWVRVYQENGTIIFEKILAAGEQYSLPSDAPAAYLRAGNATSVYVMIDDEAYGPLSDSGAVVRDIALLPTSVAGTMPEVDVSCRARMWL